MLKSLCRKFYRAILYEDSTQKQLIFTQQKLKWH